MARPHAGQNGSNALTVTAKHSGPATTTRRSTSRKLAITVLSGGPSNERAISLASGAAVADALKSLGHDVFLEDVAPDNLGALARAVDCVFIALHGTFGEDGEVQSILEQRGLLYCGSGPESCAVAMDKAAAKTRFIESNLPTPRFTIATPVTLETAIADWRSPVVVKPVKEGSSLSCTIVRDDARIRPAVEHLLERYPSCLIEEFIPGREITVGILGDTGLPPIEIRTPREFYDYAAKYEDNQTEYRLDIDLPPAFLEDLVAMSVRAHQALGCRDFSRVDWRVNDETLEPYLLEVNVIPGLTSHSLLPKAAAKAGLSMPMLGQRIVDLALGRARSK